MAAGMMLAALAACAHRPPQPATQAGAAGAAEEERPAIGQDLRVPEFARRPFEPFSRAAVIAIALREWRVFGEEVDDLAPDLQPEVPPEQMLDHREGLWQRVGEYWWLGQDAGRDESAWTGKYDASGKPIPAGREDAFAWSAAFVSYVMRIAGAGDRFPYAISHATYINAARRMALDGSGEWLISAERPDAYAPRPSDLICNSRTIKPVRFDDLPRARFPSHCDIVVALEPGQIDVVGGNVAHSVTMKHVPVTTTGMLSGPGGVVDARYAWFVVLRVNDGT
jgi:hypothetical protein